MSSASDSVNAACIFLMLAGVASLEAAPQGFMEGHLKIVRYSPVEADSTSESTVAPETYAQYPLIILGQDGKSEIAPLTADNSGNYHAVLPPGAYILALKKRQTEERAAEHIRATPEPFTIVSNQTIRVDMRIFIGPAKGQASVSSD